MNVYTIYTDSHKVLYDIFSKSLSETNPNLVLITDKVEQRGIGCYKQEGFNDIMIEKIKMIIEACKKENDYFIYADPDIKIYNKISFDSYIDCDLLGQNDFTDYNPIMCAGFMRIHPDSLWFFEMVLNNMLNNKEYINYDQTVINDNLNKISHAFLNHQYFTIGKVNGFKVWNGETDLQIPKDIITCHANWTIGVENKLKLINFINNQITAYDK